MVLESHSNSPAEFHKSPAHFWYQLPTLVLLAGDF